MISMAPRSAAMAATSRLGGGAGLRNAEGHDGYVSETR
jgi:hypothetical protein